MVQGTNYEKGLKYTWRTWKAGELEKGKNTKKQKIIFIKMFFKTKGKSFYSLGLND